MWISPACTEKLFKMFIDEYNVGFSYNDVNIKILKQTISYLVIRKTKLNKLDRRRNSTKKFLNLLPSENAPCVQFSSKSNKKKLTRSVTHSYKGKLIDLVNLIDSNQGIDVSINERDRFTMGGVELSHKEYEQCFSNMICQIYGEKAEESNLSVKISFAEKVRKIYENSIFVAFLRIYVNDYHQGSWTSDAFVNHTRVCVPLVAMSYVAALKYFETTGNYLSNFL
eukprot:NODE_616_length_5370_cov_0.348131.p4 type:complete len:225 gc:universal NODE_616_length_5370_cov_0.348131:5204-4530(-)